VGSILEFINFIKKQNKNKDRDISACQNAGTFTKLHLPSCTCVTPRKFFSDDRYNYCTNVYEIEDFWCWGFY